MSSDFDLLSSQFEPHHIGNRTESTAMLAWFLTNVWRQESDDVQNALCDGSNDKGIDAIIIDRDTREIHVFQAKRRVKETGTLGDADLKQFRGVAPYFRGPDGIDDLLAASPNQELQLLIDRLDLRDLLDERDPWSVSFVFVTNAELDASGASYLQASKDTIPPLEVFSRPHLAEIARRTERPGLIAANRTLQPRSNVIVEELEDGVEMAIALLPANELIRLPGIGDRSLFVLNVRLALGSTKINKALAETIRTEQADHALFPAFHNGITILTDEMSVDEDGIELANVTVVNGCQSLVALHENKSSLTPDLTVLTKIVQLSDNAALADTITKRSNNQNAVNMRDQRANDSIQRDLQKQVKADYGDRMFYAIRRGEGIPDGVDKSQKFENQDAAQVLTAVWLREPWAAVRKLVLFDDEYRRIFGRNIDSHKLYVAHRLLQMVTEKRGDLRDTLSASFASVKFTALFLTAAVMRLTDEGTAFLDDPSAVLATGEEEAFESISTLMDHVIAELNNYVEMQDEAREDDPSLKPFDPKVAFKNRSSITAIERHAIGITKAFARRSEDFSFLVTAD